jgi:hypothetical protein
MQKAGAIAVIVGDNRNGNLVTMGATGSAVDVTIPSVFVSLSKKAPFFFFFFFFEKKIVVFNST